MCSDSKSEADIHAAGVVLHRRVNKLLKLGESDDFIKFPLDLALAHAKNCTAKKRILAAAQFRVEAGANFEKAPNTSMNFGPSGGRLVMRERIFRRVVLPAPLRPIRPRTSPSWTSRQTSRRAQKVSWGARRKTESGERATRARVSRKVSSTSR